MSDTESHQAYIDASEASIPAENGPREVANDPPPLGSAEERENDPGVAARTRLHRSCSHCSSSDAVGSPGGIHISARCCIVSANCIVIAHRSCSHRRSSDEVGSPGGIHISARC